jgi:hypothetical protein
MARNNPVPALAAAAVVLALLVLDLHPALHHAPLILLVLAGAVQIDRELAHAFAAVGRYPSAPSMNFLTVIVVVHLAYFAQPIASSLLELVGTVAVAMYTLVVVAAIGSDLKLHGRQQAFGFMLLSLVIPVVIGGGLSCAFYVQSTMGGAPSPQGSLLVALLVAAAWLGMALGRRMLGEGRPATAAGPVRALVPAVVVLAGAFGLGLATELGTVRVLATAAAAGIGTALGCSVVDGFAARCKIHSFRWRLPSQIDFLQPIYNGLFAGGLTDYAGPLACVMPLALLALRGLGQ